MLNEGLRVMVSRLTDEERLELFRDYCGECGRYDPDHRCCCMRDD